MMTTEVRNPSEAPGELDLVRRFVNTLAIEEGTDDLNSPAEAKAWLEGEGWRTRVVERELRELVSFREAVRDLVGSRGTADDEEAVAAIDSIARRYPLVVSFASSGVLFPPSNGVPGFIERILGLVAAAEIDGSWDRMKTCANHGCRWLFFDHSRNRSRTWCTMELCGSQAKMRAYRSRQAARASL